MCCLIFFFQAEDGIRDKLVTGVQTCALPIYELFTGLKEVSTRPAVYRAWSRIAKKADTQFKWGYTVTESIAREFHRRYKVDYHMIRNVSCLRPLEKIEAPEIFVVYQEPEIERGEF